MNDRLQYKFMAFVLRWLMSIRFGLHRPDVEPDEQFVSDTKRLVNDLEEAVK